MQIWPTGRKELNKMKTIAILTAAGVGSRTHQDIPKQFLNVDNIPIIVYTMMAFQNHPKIDEIAVVILKGWDEILWAYAKQFNITKLKYVVPGGSNGQESIFNGINAVLEKSSRDDVVMVHDGNRPMVSQSIISDSLAKFAQYGCAVAAIPCTEVVFTINQTNESESLDLIERNDLRRTQTPHTYLLGELYDMHIEAKKRGIISTAASCALADALGKKSYFSLGSEKNLKITTIEDIEIFKALLHATKDDWIK